MNSNALLIRALRGPLTLIVVGFLFVMDHAEIVSFSKTWPVIIIFLGAIRLAERAFPSEPPPFNTQGGVR